MNPQLHDEFVALCALFYSGEITDEEWALLQVHLAYCDPCRGTFEEFKYVAKEVVPVMAAAASPESANAPYESAASFVDAQYRLINSLDTESGSKHVAFFEGVVPRVMVSAVTACVVVLLAFVGWHYLRREPSFPEEAHGSKPAIAESSTPRAPLVSANSQAEAQREQREIVELRQQINILESSAKGSNSAVATLVGQLQAERDQRVQDASQKQLLTQQLAAAQAALHDLRDQVVSAQAAAVERTAEIATMETKVQTLNAALEDANSAINDKDRVLALDRDFLAHDKDIRDLIGARNLYIADIFDTTESGKTAKPFGRIFYTQDRSLVFYGFDLEKQAGLAHSVAFQAWGSGSDRQPVSLGLFYQDDSHKRWVVRCEDAKSLARLNMVFVTVEPPGGSSRPTGKQLLRAYLQIQPNHP